MTPQATIAQSAIVACTAYWQSK